MRLTPQRCNWVSTCKERMRNRTFTGSLDVAMDEKCRSLKNELAIVSASGIVQVFFL